MKLYKVFYFVKRLLRKFVDLENSRDCSQGASSLLEKVFTPGIVLVCLIFTFSYTLLCLQFLDLSQINASQLGT